MNIEKLKALLSVLDLPSGVIMAIVTLTTLVVGAHLAAQSKDIPATFLTMYGLIVGPFCVHKTTVAIKNSTEQQTTTTEEQPQK